MSIEEP